MDLEIDERELLDAAPGRRAQPRRPLPPRAPDPRAQARRRGRRDRGDDRAAASCRPRQRRALTLFDACIPAIPYAAAAAFLGREKPKLTRSDGDRPRVALVADGLGGMHGVTHTIQQIRDRGVPGFEVEVIGTDADVDRRLSAVAEIDVPFYRGLKIGVPSVPAIVDALAEGRYDLVHLCSPGPGRARRLAAGPGARAAGGRQLPHRARRLRRAAHRPGAPRGARRRSRWRRSTAPATSSSRRARPATSGSTELGIARRPDRPLGSRRRPRAVRPGAARRRALLPGEINVLYAGRLTKEKGVELLADAFLAARCARSAAAPGARRRRPRGGRAARAARRRTPRSWAGSAATTWPAPTRAPTCSCSPAGPTRSAR